VGVQELELFAQLYDEPGTPPLEARLPALHARELVVVLEKLSATPKRLGDLGDDVFPTEMWHETNSQNDGTIRRETRFPAGPAELIYQGPHIYVANPLYKTPRAICDTNLAHDPLDLTALPADYLPRTNYVPACDPNTYRDRTPVVAWRERLPVTEAFRVLFRRGLSQAGERTLLPALAPPGVGHVDGCLSIAFRDARAAVGFAAVCSSLVADFLVKTTGKADFRADTARRVPVFEGSTSLEARVLLLNCLSSGLGYDSIWQMCWNSRFREERWTREDPRLPASRFTALSSVWGPDTPVRTDYERRQALIEIDVLIAQALGLTLEELLTIYRIQFPVLQQNERDTWYDRNGRIVFTVNRGLPGVGVDRSQWNEIRDMKSGAISRTIIDDTLPDGPRERTITYGAPFDRCDREGDYRLAWAEFERRARQPQR
jgi:hypothetical protein